MTEFDWIADDESSGRRRRRRWPRRTATRSTPSSIASARTSRTVALVQLAWADQIAVVDPLAVDLQPLAKVLEGPGIAVMHAAGQDLEVLELACGTVPTTLFDTQLAAGFVGYATPSLATLVEQVVGVRLPKGDRLTDWLRRPLDARPAAATPPPTSPTCFALQDHLSPTSRPAAGSSGRTTSASCSAPGAARCASPRTRGSASRRPATCGARPPASPGGGGLAGATGGGDRPAGPLRAPRPRRWSGIASGPPTHRDQLRAIRGLDDRHLRGRARRRAARGGRPRPRAPARCGPGGRDDEVDRDLRPAVALVSAWVSQLAGTSASTPRCSPPEPTSRPSSAATGRPAERGWRADLVGEPVRRLVEGEAALAFDGDGGLVLEERSQRSSIRRGSDGCRSTAASRQSDGAGRTAWSGASVPANGSPSPAPSLATSTVPARPGTATGSLGEVHRHHPAIVAERCVPHEHAVGRVDARLVADREGRRRPGRPGAAGTGAGSSPGPPVAPRRCGRRRPAARAATARPAPAVAGRRGPRHRRPAPVPPAGIDHPRRPGPRRPRAPAPRRRRGTASPAARAAARRRPGPAPRSRSGCGGGALSWFDSTQVGQPAGPTWVATSSSRRRHRSRPPLREQRREVEGQVQLVAAAVVRRPPWPCRGGTPRRPSSGRRRTRRAAPGCGAAARGSAACR